MTFQPTATRIRLNLHPQRVSILLPIVAVEALFAALSFSSGQAQGDGSPCGRLPMLAISIAPDAVPPSTSVSNDLCSATLTPSPTFLQDRENAHQGAAHSGVGSSCSVSIGSAAVRAGDGVGAQFTGECSGLELAMTVRPNAGLAMSPLLSATSGSAYCKIIGKDVPGIDMFWNKSSLTWDYSNLAVSNPRHRVTRYDNIFWYLVSSNSGVLSDGGTQYDAYDYAHWYSNGFPFGFMPDVEAWAQPTVIARGRGYWHCDFWVRTGKGWGTYGLVFNYGQGGS